MKTKLHLLEYALMHLWAVYQVCMNTKIVYVNPIHTVSIYESFVNTLFDFSHCNSCWPVCHSDYFSLFIFCIFFSTQPFKADESLWNLALRIWFCSRFLPTGEFYSLLALEGSVDVLLLVQSASRHFGCYLAFYKEKLIDRLCPLRSLGHKTTSNCWETNVSNVSMLSICRKNVNVKLSSCLC